MDTNYKKIKRDRAIELDIALKEIRDRERKIQANNVLQRGLQKKLRLLKQQALKGKQAAQNFKKKTASLEIESSQLKKTSRKEQLDHIKEINQRERLTKDKIQKLEAELLQIQKEKQRINVAYLQSASKGQRFKKEAFRSEEGLFDLKREEKTLKDRIQQVSDEVERIKKENNKLEAELRRSQEDIKKKKRSYREALKLKD